MAQVGFTFKVLNMILKIDKYMPIYFSLMDI